MTLPTWVMKILAFLLAAITPFGSTALLSTLPASGDAAVVQTLKSAGGFMTGVCHPEPEYKRIKNANIGWIRVDIPYPFDKSGKQTESYKNWKKEMKQYVKNGIKVYAVTPYPEKFREVGLDIRNEKHIPKIQKVVQFLVKDLRGIVGCYQVTNEMGVDRFTLPLTMDEAAKFIGVQLEAMSKVKKKGELIGYNLGGLGYVQLPPRMIAYNRYCDYVGIDIYLGCFETVTKTLDEFTAVLRYARKVSGRPVILSEFGYISYGEPKTAAEKKKIMNSYGFKDEADARKNINKFIKKLPPRLRDEITRNYADKSASEKASIIFDGEYANHIYRELPEGTGLYDYPHTPKGQAKFYKDVLARLNELDFLVGAFLYMWDDSDSCYVCGQADCPVETGWGIVDGKGKLKPAYTAVKNGFAVLKNK